MHTVDIGVAGVFSFFVGLISYMGSPKPFPLCCGWFFVGTFSKKSTFVGKPKQLWFSVGNSEAKRFCVGNIKTTQ